MIIEFVAVPGSGKSHFADKLFNHLKNEMTPLGYTIFNRGDIDNIKRNKIVSISKNRIFTRLYLLFNIAKVIDIRVFGHIINLFFTPGHSFLVKRKRVMYLIDILLNYKIIDNINKEHNNNCIFILDEGLLHISSMCMRECNKKNLDKFFKAFKRKLIIKQIFVFIDCKTENLFDRLTNRPSGWPMNWKNLDSNSKLFELEKSYKKYSTKKDFVVDGEKQNYIIDNSIYFENYALFYESIMNKLLVDF